MKKTFHLLCCALLLNEALFLPALSRAEPAPATDPIELKKWELPLIELYRHALWHADGAEKIPPIFWIEKDGKFLAYQKPHATKPDKATSIPTPAEEVAAFRLWSATVMNWYAWWSENWAYPAGSPPENARPDGKFLPYLKGLPGKDSDRDNIWGPEKDRDNLRVNSVEHMLLYWSRDPETRKLLDDRTFKNLFFVADGDSSDTADNKMGFIDQFRRKIAKDFKGQLKELEAGATALAAPDSLAAVSTALKEPLRRGSVQAATRAVEAVEKADRLYPADMALLQWYLLHQEKSGSGLPEPPGLSKASSDEHYTASGLEPAALMKLRQTLIGYARNYSEKGDPVPGEGEDFDIVPGLDDTPVFEARFLRYHPKVASLLGLSLSGKDFDKDSGRPAVPDENAVEQLGENAEVKAALKQLLGAYAQKRGGGDFGPLAQEDAAFLEAVKEAYAETPGGAAALAEAEAAGKKEAERKEAERRNAEAAKTRALDQALASLFKDGIELQLAKALYAADPALKAKAAAAEGDKLKEILGTALTKEAFQTALIAYFTNTGLSPLLKAELDKLDKKAMLQYYLDAYCGEAPGAAAPGAGAKGKAEEDLKAAAKEGKEAAGAAEAGDAKGAAGKTLDGAAGGGALGPHCEDFAKRLKELKALEAAETPRGGGKDLEVHEPPPPSQPPSTSPGVPPSPGPGGAAPNITADKDKGANKGEEKKSSLGRIALTAGIGALAFGAAGFLVGGPIGALAFGLIGAGLGAGVAYLNANPIK